MDKEQFPWYCDDSIYVDDFLTIGTNETIKEVIDAFKSHNFELKAEDNLTDNLTFKTFQKRDQGKAWIMQHHLIDNLEKQFGDDVRRLHSYTLPGTPRFKIVRPAVKMECTDTDMQSRY